MLLWRKRACISLSGTLFRCKYVANPLRAACQPRNFTPVPDSAGAIVSRARLSRSVGLPEDVSRRKLLGLFSAMYALSSSAKCPITGTSALDALDFVVLTTLRHTALRIDSVLVSGHQSAGCSPRISDLRSPAQNAIDIAKWAWPVKCDRIVEASSGL